MHACDTPGCDSTDGIAGVAVTAQRCGGKPNAKVAVLQLCEQCQNDLGPKRLRQAVLAETERSLLARGRRAARRPYRTRGDDARYES